MLFCKSIKPRGTCMSTINDYLLSAIMVEITWKSQNFYRFARRKKQTCCAFCTYIFIIMNITTLLRINSFSRLQIISLFPICNIVYFTTLQEPFNSGRSFTIHANITEWTDSIFLNLRVLLHCGKPVKFEC